MSDFIKNLEEELLYKKCSVFEKEGKAGVDAAMEYAEGYRRFLDRSKTEREAVEATIEILTANEFTEYKIGDKIVPGGRYYLKNRNKSIYIMKIGSESPENGVRVNAAHIDSPRLDLKQHPLFEDNGVSYFKTHYYGGIRKYQWATIPLALHGVVVKRGGDSVTVKIGDEPGDPVFCITDLLPHLAKEQNAKTLATAFTGEGLNVLIGSMPVFDGDAAYEEKNSVKLAVLRILNEKYGITESDFMSAELCAVPAQNAVDVGFDRWFMGAYGHDDKVCAYPALTALVENLDSPKTIITVFADKEETGSDGPTGMQSKILVDLIDEISAAMGADPAVVRSNSKCLSADVNAAFDPNYADAWEKRNAAMLSCGVSMSKYTGSGGKSSTNDATAEFVGFVRDLFDKNNVVWQTAELGKVDGGGGGTVAKYISKENIDTVDIGVPVLSMHAPFEIISKGDLYSAHKAFSAFCK